MKYFVFMAVLLVCSCSSILDRPIENYSDAVRYAKYLEGKQRTTDTFNNMVVMIKLNSKFSKVCSVEWNSLEDRYIDVVLQVDGNGSVIRGWGMNEDNATACYLELAKEFVFPKPNRQPYYHHINLK